MNLRNLLRWRTPLQNIVTIRTEDGTVLHTIHLARPTRFRPNTCEIVVPNWARDDDIWKQVP